MFDSAKKYDLQSAVELSNKKMFDKYNSDPDNSEFSREDAWKNWLETYTKVFWGANLESIYEFAKNNKQFKESLDFIRMYEWKKEEVKKETRTETRQLKSDIKKSQSKEKRNNNSISEEVLKNKWYIIQKNDWLSVVTKWIDINFNEKANLIYPGDIVKIEKWDLIITRIKTWKKEVVWTLIGYNVTKTPLNRSQWIDSWVIVPGIEKPKVKEKTEKELQKKREEEEKAREDEESSLWEKEILSDFKWESDIQEFDLENLWTFFNIDLSNLNNKIKENWLDLDLVQFLSKYELYIETNLSKFEYKDKIIESISKKIQKLEEIIDKRIAWVDEQIGEWDYDEENRQKEIQNQRWIINSHLQELFSDINNKALPSAYLIVNKKSDIWDSSERTNMFSAKLTEDWDFDKSIWTWEAYDALTDNWNTLDASDENDRKILDKAWVKIIDSPSILSPEDIEREKKVESYYIGYVLISMLPYLWAWLALPSDIADLVSDEEWVSKVLRTMWVIDENYRMEKSYWDNILGWVWIVLSVFWLQALARAKKWAKAFSLAKWFTTSEIKKSISELWKLMNLPKEQIDKALSFLKKSNNVDNKKLTFDTELEAETKVHDLSLSNPDKKYIVELKDWKYNVLEKSSRSIHDRVNLRQDLWNLKDRSVEELAARRDLINKEISKWWLLEPEVRKLNKEINSIEWELRLRKVADKSAEESAEIFEGISIDHFNKFKKIWEVPDEILDSIVLKIKKWDKLSAKETDIRNAKNNEIEERLKKFQKQETSNKTWEKFIESKKGKQRATETLREHSISRFEQNKFKSILLKRFSDNNYTVLLKNKKWEEINIVKQSNGLYLINWKGTPLKERKMLSQIDESFKIDLLNQYNLEQILKITKGKEFNLLKTLWHPINWKIQVKESWEVFLNGKKLSKERTKSLISIPNIRKAILKQDMERMTTEEILSRMESVKWFKEKFKSFWNSSLKMAAERIKALAQSWAILWTWSVLLEVFFDAFSWWEHAETSEERALELFNIFLLWWLSWVVLSWIKTWTMLIYWATKWSTKLWWNIVKTPTKLAIKNKWITSATISALWIWSYIYLTPKEQKEILNQNTQ